MDGRFYCYHCGEAQALVACKNCQSALYCSVECQKKDWEHEHSEICSDIAFILQANTFDDHDYLQICSEIGLPVENDDSDMIGRRCGRKVRRGKRSVVCRCAKARKILREGKTRGHRLTAKQKRFFGWMAGGCKRRSRKKKRGKKKKK